MSAPTRHPPPEFATLHGRCAASRASSTSTAIPRPRRCCGAMTDALAHRGPDGEGQLRGRRRSGSATGGSRSSTSRRPGDQPMATEDGRYVDLLQRRGLQLPRAASRARGAGHPLPLAAPTPRSCCTRSPNGARRRLLRLNGMFALALWDAARARAVAGPRPLRDQAALLDAPRRRCFMFGSEIKALLPHPGFRRPARPRGAVRVLHLPEPLHRAHAVRRRLAAAAGLPAAGRARRARTLRPERYWDFEFREPEPGRATPPSTWRSSTGCSGRRSTGSSSRTCPSAPT